MKRYSILMYNFNGYELLREPEEVDPECDYIYVTDTPDICKESKIWRVVVDPKLEGMSTFEKCYTVRFNPFRYANTYVCIYLDASIQIHRSLRKLFNDFESSCTDIGLNIHPDAETLPEEYRRWVHHRGYDPNNANRILTVLHLLGYDMQYKGLYQGGCRICRNTPLNNKIDNLTFSLLSFLGKDGIIERVDQTIYSFIVNKFFENIKVFPFSQQVFQSDYMTLMIHGTNDPMPYNPSIEKTTGFLFNKETELYKI